MSTKYNDLIPAESSSLTEKPSEISDSQVSSNPGSQPLSSTESGFGDELQLKSKSPPSEFHKVRKSSRAKSGTSPKSEILFKILFFSPPFVPSPF